MFSKNPGASRKSEKSSGTAVRAPFVVLPDWRAGWLLDCGSEELLTGAIGAACCADAGTAYVARPVSAAHNIELVSKRAMLSILIFLIVLSTAVVSVGLVILDGMSIHAIQHHSN